jgi:hypothetical protein
VIKEKLTLVTEKFGQSWAACMVAMTQGDLSVVSLGHAITASKTGILTGLAMLAASFLPWNNKWLGIFLTGAFTAIADALIHSDHFPAEHLATGAGAMLLAIVFERTFNTKY